MSVFGLQIVRISVRLYYKFNILIFFRRKYMSGFKENLSLSFGIDLGIASLGWAVVNLKENKIIDKGVYLFSEAEKAEDRRHFRSDRRRKKRKLHRIERIYQVLQKNGITLVNIDDSELLNKRLKAIKEKVEMQDIVNIIFYFARHRGYIPFSDDNKDERKSEVIDGLRKQNYLACEMQKKVLSDNNHYRGDEFLILHSDYDKELKTILKEQSKYYKEIDEKFINDIVDIINSKRAFWEGPGGPRENQLNKYGRYRTVEDLEKYKKDKNYNKYLFENLIGNCSVYEGEKKASAWNFYAECFDFYNDMVNLRIDSQNLDETNFKYFEEIGRGIYKLKNESIKKLKDVVLETKNVNYNKIFKKEFNVNFEDVYGYKKDKNGKPQIAKFEKIRFMINKIEDKDKVDNLLSNMDAYNRAMYLIQVSPSKETRYEILEDNFKGIYSEELIVLLSECNLDNKYHSFSEKALKVYLELMEEYNQNSSYIERNYQDYIQSDVKDSLINNYANDNIKEGDLKYISVKYIDDIIASPAVKKSLRKAIALLNKLFSKYGYPGYICIENTRDLLSVDKQKEYEVKTLDNQLKRKNAAKRLKEEGFEGSKNNIDKYLLLQETNSKCAYCNKDITVGDCEIEHILPKSKTANDTFSNKTVSCTHCNTQKNNRTPYEYLTSINMWNDFFNRVKNNKKFIQEKKENLLFDKNINKYEKNFKNRNLNDTSYATNELANQINLFKKAYLKHNYGEFLDTKILRVPGQFTGILRDKAKIEKNRDLKYHHAVDAVIVACTPQMRVGKLMDMIQNEPDKYWKINNLDEYREDLYSKLYLNKNITEELLMADFSNTRMAREVINKKSGQLFDANVSKVIFKDENYYKVEQINNIYDLPNNEFGKDDKGNYKDYLGKKYFLCQDNNKELYKRLCDIVEMYKDKNVNPFLEYCKENNMEKDEKFDYRKHGIKQNEKNPNSAIVKKLRFLSKVSNPYILDTSKLIKSNKKNKKDIMLMYDSLKSYCTRVYRDSTDGKLYFMPIYKIFINNKSGKIRTDSEYYRQTFERFVKNTLTEEDFYMDLYNNEYVRFENKNGEISEGYVVGFHKTLNKVVIKKSSSITSSTKSIKKIKSDILGLYNLNI